MAKKLYDFIKRKLAWLFIGGVALAAATTAIPIPSERAKINDVIGAKEVVLEHYNEKKEVIQNSKYVAIKYAYIGSSMDESIPSAVNADAQKRGMDIMGEVVERRTSHARTFATTKENTFITEIVSDTPQYYRDESGKWWQAEYATTTSIKFNALPKSPLYKTIEATRSTPFIQAVFRVRKALAAISTFFPDPDPETSTVDGSVGRSGALNESWTTIRTTTGNDARPSNATESIVRFDCGTDTNTYKNVFRGIFLFDTSSIPDSDAISSATLSIWITTKADNNSNTPDIDIYTVTPASNTDIVNGDYLQFGSTSQTGSATTYASVTTGQYTNFTLNATGIGNISKIGVSKFGTQNANKDVANVAPSWNSGNCTGGFDASMAETAGTTQDPKLVVEHAAAASSGEEIINVWEE